MNGNKPNVAVNYIYNLLYQIIAVLLPIIITPFISRTLQAEAIGAYSYSFTIANYFALFGIMGFNMYGQLQISKSRDDSLCLSEKFWGIWTAKTITTIISLIIYLIMIASGGKYKSLFLTYIIMISANIFDISWFFQGIEEFKKIVFRNFIIKSISLVLIFSLIKDENDIIIYSLILHGSTFLGNISLWFSLNKYLSKVKLRGLQVKEHLKKSFAYFIPAIMASIFTSVDKVMLGAFWCSDYYNGIYEQAHKVELALYTIVSSLSTVLLPRMSYLYNNNKISEYKKYLSSSLGIVGLIAIPMMFGVVGVSDVFIPIFLGDGFSPCILLLRIFSILIFISGLNTIIGNQCLVACGKQKQYNLGVIIGAILNIALNAALIPLANIFGAAIASVIAEISMLFVFICNCTEYIHTKELIKLWYKEAIVSIFMAFIIYVIGKVMGVSIYTLLIQIAVGILIEIIGLYMAKDHQFFAVIGIIRNKFNR